MLRLVFIASLAGLASCAMNPELVEPMTKRGISVAHVYASMETVPVASSDDAADDPAIWVNHQDGAASRILGTDKQSGLAVYNLSGEILQFLELGRLNNVDLRQQVEVDGALVDIAAATNRTDIGFDLFAIDAASGEVQPLGNWPVDLVEPYGICMYRDVDNRAQVFVNGTSGRYQQWLLESIEPLQLSLLREFSVASQPEGCAADDQQHQLFLGEEEHGIWRIATDPGQSDMQLLDEVDTGAVVADVEGMDIYRVSADQAYLVVSSQGDFTYAVYQAQGDYEYLGSFQIVANEETGIDGAQETDGLTLSAANLGPGLERGALVVQDGFNRMPRDRQNFKLVPWETIARALNLDD